MSFPRKQESSIQHIWGSEAIEARADGMMSAADEKAARALLDWYRAMGVDEAIGEEPVDCFAAAIHVVRRCLGTGFDDRSRLGRS